MATPVSLLVIVTVAPETTAPLASKTFPSIAPRSTCPKEGRAEMLRNATTKIAQLENPRIFIHGFIGFIAVSRSLTSLDFRLTSNPSPDSSPKLLMLSQRSRQHGQTASVMPSR